MRACLVFCLLALPVCAQSAREWADKGRVAFEAEDFDEAVHLFRKAVAIAPQDDGLQRNLATCLQAHAQALLAAREFRNAQVAALEALELVASSERRYLLALIHVRASQDEQARPYLDTLLAAEPAHVRGLELLGWIDYRSNRTAAAIESWRAIPEAERSAALRRRLTKAEQDLAIEHSFHGWETTHFNIRSDAAVPDPLPKLVGDALEDAYTSIGYDLGVYPERVISVLIYTTEDFEELARVEWARGLYDGKIRLAVGGLDENDRDDLAKLLRHEYAHVLLHELTPRVPAWVHEGIASWLDGTSVDGAKGRLRAARKIPRLRDLYGSFTAIADAGAARLAYDLCLVTVDTIVARWGAVRMVDWVRAMATAADAEEAFALTFVGGLDELEGEIREELGR